MPAASFDFTGKRQREILSLTGLRFFAAFFILLAHAVDWLVQFQGVERDGRLAITAMYGMPLFFVLSGFVIHYNYSKLFLGERKLNIALSEFAAARMIPRK